MDVVFHTNFNYKEVWDTPVHQHECYEMSYIYTGAIRVLLPNQSFILHAHQFLFLPPNTPHTSEIVEGPVEHIFMLTSQYPANVPPCVAMDDLPDDVIGLLFKQIYLEYNRKPTRNIDLFFAWQSLIDAYCRQFNSSESTCLVSSMRRMLHGNITNPDFSIDESFATLGFSINHLRTLFKNEVGVTPKEYLTDQRISHACQLLTFSKKLDLLIKDVAMRSGFKDPLYFSRYFRQKLGVTPSEYLLEHCNGSMGDKDYIRMSRFQDQTEAQYFYPVYSERFANKNV